MFEFLFCVAALVALGYFVLPQYFKAPVDALLGKVAEGIAWIKSKLTKSQ